MSWARIGVLAVCGAPWAVAALGGEPAPVQEPPVSFSRDVAPLLNVSCLSCHAGDAPFGELDLSSAGGIGKGGVSGGLIVAGNPGASVLVQRLRGEGGKPQMPMALVPAGKSNRQPSPPFRVRSLLLQK